MPSRAKLSKLRPRQTWGHRRTVAAENHEDTTIMEQKPPILKHQAVKMAKMKTRYWLIKAGLRR